VIFAYTMLRARSHNDFCFYAMLRARAILIELIEPQSFKNKLI